MYYTNYNKLIIFIGLLIVNGHTKRAIKKGNNIKKAALNLFNKYGADKVSVDKIADYANVSKVTIYKYFKNKDGLYKEIIKMLLDESIKALQNVVDSDMPFLEKLKFLITTKTDSLQYMKGAFSYELIQGDYEIKEYLENSLSKIKGLMFSFLDCGKKEGYIDTKISNETFLLYMDVVGAGFQEKASSIKSAFSDKDTFENLINLYFYGLIKRP